MFVLWPQQVCQIVPELFFFLLVMDGWNVKQLCLACPELVFSSPSYECAVWDVLIVLIVSLLLTPHSGLTPCLVAP